METLSDNVSTHPCCTSLGGCRSSGTTNDFIKKVECVYCILFKNRGFVWPTLYQIQQILILLKILIILNIPSINYLSLLTIEWSWVAYGTDGLPRIDCAMVPCL